VEDLFFLIRDLMRIDGCLKIADKSLAVKHIQAQTNKMPHYQLIANRLEN